MLYSATLDSHREASLAELDELRADLGRRIVGAEGWIKLLRRFVSASAYSSSTRVEGFVTGVGRAMEIVDRSAPTDRNEEALASYLRAMRHVGLLATDPLFEWSTRLILDLHFDTCSFQDEIHPGRLREGPIFVKSDAGEVVFTGPDAEALPALVDEFSAGLRADETSHPVIKAALAHLNLISIHPFEDGNGRVSRVLQSLVLARTGETAPEFGSIEEYVAEHTADYYAALQEVQGGGLTPDRSPLPWIDFCIEAHRAQAVSRIALVESAAQRWDRLERAVAERGWPDRLVVALEQALAGSTRRSTYMDEVDVSEPTASNDLRRLVDAGLLDIQGGGRSQRYVAAPPLRRLVD